MWSFHRSGRGCQRVARLWESRSFLRWIGQAGAVVRSLSSGSQVLLGQYGATNKTCSSSSLILHSVCASRLTGASCVPVHPCRALPQLGSKTPGSVWFLEMQTGPPEQLRTVHKSAEPPGDGVSSRLEVLLETGRRLPDWTLLGCGWHEGTSDASDSRGGGGGQVATCDGSVNRLAGWYTQRSQYCPYGPDCPCPEGALWGGLRQGVLPATRGNWYANAVEDPSKHLILRACCTWLPSRWPRHPWIPQHVWIPAPGALLQKVGGIWPWADGFAAGRCNLNPVSTAFPRPPRDSAMEPVLKRSHMEQTERDCRCSCSHMPQEPLKEFKWGRCLNAVDWGSSDPIWLLLRHRHTLVTKCSISSLILSQKKRARAAATIRSAPRRAMSSCKYLYIILFKFSGTTNWVLVIIFLCRIPSSSNCRWCHSRKSRLTASGYFNLSLYLR